MNRLPTPIRRSYHDAILACVSLAVSFAVAISSAQEAPQSEISAAAAEAVQPATELVPASTASQSAPASLANEQPQQTREEADTKSWGCVQCHAGVTDMHAK